MEKLPGSQLAIENNLVKRDAHINPEEGLEIAQRLLVILEKYKDKRVLVLAPPCFGKTTILKHIKNGIDMDIVFDTMPEEFKRHVLHHEYPIMFIDGDRETIKFTEKKFVPGDNKSEEYLEDTTRLLTEYVNSHLKIVPGRPVFGTNIIDTDVIVYLKLSDDDLDARLQSRNTKTHRLLQRDRVYAIKRLIEKEIKGVANKDLIIEEFQVS